MRKLGNRIYLQILRTLALPSGLPLGPHPARTLHGGSGKTVEPACSPRALEARSQGEGGGRRSQRFRTVVTGSALCSSPVPTPTCHSVPCAVWPYRKCGARSSCLTTEVTHVAAQSSADTQAHSVQGRAGSLQKGEGRGQPWGLRPARVGSAHVGVQALGPAAFQIAVHPEGHGPTSFPGCSGGTRGPERLCSLPKGTQQGQPPASLPHSEHLMPLPPRAVNPRSPQANLPLLQRELLHCARLAKQTPAQYLAQHEQLLLDASASSPIDSSELLLEVNENGKRRTPDRTKENGSDRDPLHLDHLSKRPCTLSPAQRYSPSHGLPHPTPPPHYRLEDMAMAHHFRDSFRHLDPRELRERHRQLAVHGSRPEEVIDHRLTEREWAEEWKHLNNLLNCIMDMAEKTRRSLTVLRRCQEADREELNHWIRRYSGAEDKKSPAPAARPLHSSAGVEGSQLDVHQEFMPRTLSGYMPEEIWRKAEEAVSAVKRQAMSELQKAVSDAERKAHELISTERAKMERALAEARRQASEDALTVVNQQEDSSESCWNCGRKASETCSGCNAARYCGSFCQHKDWEKHHHVCGQSLQGPAAVAADPAPGQPDAASLGPCLPATAASPSEAGSTGPSRPGSPGPPGPLDAAPR
ncbi:protein CBFA2T3 isoform X2 [Camelus ferus]|uniref:Protein CBFA2T3 isoform X2 n=2 Tax=Camelus TaxID=9836 RepID=A0A8B8RRA7_CAMFR|nr:protein CBFA2T3 isoform X2 [Camelus ferus]